MGATIRTVDYEAAHGHNMTVDHPVKYVLPRKPDASSLLSSNVINRW